MITIGTDCSGIEAPIQALQQLGIPFRHKWACEIDKFARKSILANYQPEILYQDITTRDHSQLPDIDIYVCGFPCQSFSLMGKKMGSRDPRSNIMMHCIQVIETKKPRVFILENVKNFKFIEKGKPYVYLLNALTSITDDQNESIYDIYPDIYNTKDYGIPQNRERIYIIGILRDIQLENYTKPEKLPMKPLDNFILDKTINNIYIPNKTLFKKINNKSKNFICPSDTFTKGMYNICPTLTTRCDMFYHSTYNRYLTTKECLSLQGFPINFTQSISNTQMFKQAGNSMSVNVLKEIYKEIFKCTLLKDIL
jgi:DNA (cytosine-5)-methyltransferase 1